MREEEKRGKSREEGQINRSGEVSGGRVKEERVAEVQKSN